MQAIINGEMYEVEPAVKVILDRVMTENAELKRENKRFENHQGVVELLRDYGIKDISTLKYILDQYQKFIVEITHGKLSCLTYSAETILSVASDIYNEDLEKAIAEIDELKAENARLEEGYQKSIGVIAATDCVECQAWIDASIRQPDDNEGDVLVWYQCKYCGKTIQSWSITFYNRGDWYKKHLYGECINVLFWHKLPKPPIRECDNKKDGGADNETD